MIETTRGLPNTCSICGRPCDVTWWANNIDQARAGGGVCTKCRGGKGDKVAVVFEADVTVGAARLADEFGVDLATVQGTGQGGRITVTDVRKAARGV
jgi:hypothetical protein